MLDVKVTEIRIQLIFAFAEIEICWNSAFSEIGKK